MRRAAIAIVLGMVLPGFGAAAFAVVPVSEQVVEGHTVWVAIDVVRNATGTELEDFAAAVAVLVQEETRHKSFASSRFPGVLWFDDQYLVGPAQDHKEDAQQEKRYPCTGAIIAVNRDDPVDQDLQGRWTLLAPTYANESYYVTDPNDHAWIVDLWTTAWGTRAWTVALVNNDAGASIPDDGLCRGASYQDLRLAPHRRSDPGANGMDYPCEGCDALRYNAVLYFRLVHLTAVNATKDHRENVGADWFLDASGCHDSDIADWDCPGGDDSREGNSHPFRPALAPGTGDEATEVHGGSAPCPDGSEQGCHATRDIDVYYGYVAPPVVRNFVLVDVVGSAASYHCHEPEATCEPENVWSSG